MAMAAKEPISYTSLELALMEYFSDGRKKPVAQVLKFIQEHREDSQITRPNMAKCIQALRKKLPNGRQIHCVSEGRRKFYIMTRSLSSL